MIWQTVGNQSNWHKQSPTQAEAERVFERRLGFFGED